MRRALTAFGTLAAAAMLSVSVTQSAGAATGDLIINGKVHSNPSGCFDSDRWPLGVDNRTDDLVLIFEDASCSGSVIAVVPPGSRQVSEFGASVFVR
ncbi:MULTISPECIES: hypothetical protein [unclassified Streptomyces]|uniref:hypothetical protein n=1 Tax=unclassified Streptomyces TaxID=2593676 RepID=UPI00325020EC